MKCETARALNLSTCWAISPAGLSHWSQCRCVNLYHLRLGPIQTEQPLCYKSSPPHTLNFLWKLCISPIRDPHIWPYPPQTRHPLSSFPLCYPTFLLQHLRAAHGGISTSLKNTSIREAQLCHLSSKGPGKRISHREAQNSIQQSTQAPSHTLNTRKTWKGNTTLIFLTETEQNRLCKNLLCC